MEQTLVYGLEKMTNNVIKSNNCNQCDYASLQAGHLKHLKTHSGKKQTNATNVTMHPLRQAISGHI